MLIDRLDVEVCFLGLSATATAALWAALPVDPAPLHVGALAGSATITAVYALRIWGQAIVPAWPSTAGPSVAARAFESTVRALRAFSPLVAPTLSQGPVKTVVLSDADLWKMQLYSFLVAADLNGDSFSMRTMIAKGFVTDTAYRKLSAPLKAAGILEPSKAGTDYAPGMTKQLARQAIWRGLLVPDGRPPRVTL